MMMLPYTSEPAVEFRSIAEEAANNPLLQRALQQPGIADVLEAYAACSAAMNGVPAIRHSIHISYGMANASAIED